MRTPVSASSMPSSMKSLSKDSSMGSDLLGTGSSPESQFEIAVWPSGMSLQPQVAVRQGAAGQTGAGYRSNAALMLVSRVFMP